MGGNEFYRSAYSANNELVAYDPVEQVQVLKWRFEGMGREMPPLAPMRLRSFFPQELPLRLALAGLELVARCGDFTGGFDGSSPNQICVAQAATTSNSCGHIARNGPMGNDLPPRGSWPFETVAWGQFKFSSL